MKLFYTLIFTLCIGLILSGCNFRAKAAAELSWGGTDVMAQSSTSSETVTNTYDGDAASVQFVKEIAPTIGDVVDRVTPLPDRPVVVVPPENAPPDTPIIVNPPESEGGQSMEDILDGKFGQGG